MAAAAPQAEVCDGAAGGGSGSGSAAAPAEGRRAGWTARTRRPGSRGASALAMAFWVESRARKVELGSVGYGLIVHACNPTQHEPTPRPSIMICHRPDHPSVPRCQVCNDDDDDNGDDDDNDDDNDNDDDDDVRR